MIKIKTKLFVNSKGEKCREILSVKGVSPAWKFGEKYKNSLPRLDVYKLNNKKNIILHMEDSYSILFQTNESSYVYTDEEYQKILRKINEAGEMAHNEWMRLKALRKLWSGIKEDEI